MVLAHRNILFGRRALVAAGLLSLFLCLLVMAFLFQGSRGIWQPDEGYYTGIALTMLEKDSLTIPYLGEDEIFLDKPPMVYWGIIAGLKVFGHSEFAARFFNGLCFVLTALAVGALSFSLFKNKWLAMLSSIVYATMVVPFFAANFVTPDTVLALWTTLSALFFYNSIKSDCKDSILWKMLLCAAVGLGFLTKGPAALIPCGGMFVFLLVRKRFYRYFWTPWSLLGVLIFLITGLGWYIWIGFKIPGSLNYFFDNQILGRLITAKYNRNPGLAGALIYLPVLVLGSLPWSAVWLEKSKFVKTTFLNKKWWSSLADKPQLLFLLTCFFVPLVVLCLASSKLGLYALPVFAPLAIATANQWYRKATVLAEVRIKQILGVFRRPIVLTGCWVVLLLMSKLALSYYPTHKNMEMLWSQIKQHLPAGDYELCTIDDRADGLLFYGVNELEHLTDEADPYPTFTKTEHVLEEVQEFICDNETGLFLVTENDEISEAIKVLRESGIECRIVLLSYQRALLFPHYAWQKRNG